jgi:hypothetical protein
MVKMDYIQYGIKQILNNIFHSMIVWSQKYYSIIVFYKLNDLLQIFLKLDDHWMVSYVF